MSKMIAFAIVCFAIALAVVLGTQLSADAMAVVLGAVCGVAASVPTSALILFLAKRRQASMASPQAQVPPSPYPTILVLPQQGYDGQPSPGMYPGQMAGQPMPNWAQPAQRVAAPLAIDVPQRQFRVIGSTDPRFGDSGDNWGE